MPQNQTPRQRARAQTLEDITRIGRRHLATEGAAALSVRAVARDLGVVSSAIYRYVRSRDDLLTLLLVDGYNDLGDAVDEAAGAVAADDFRGRFLAIGRAVRTWALREPATYALLFGSPVPGYRAPSDQTTGPGTRVITALVFRLCSVFISRPRGRRRTRTRLAWPADLAHPVRRHGADPRRVLGRHTGRPGGARSPGLGRTVRLRQLRGLRPVRPRHLHRSR